MENTHTRYLAFIKEIGAGYLIVKTYPKLFNEFKMQLNLTHDLYAFPRIDKDPEQNSIQYRGLDRDALTENEYSNNLAEIRLDELEKINKCYHGLIEQFEYAQDAFNYLENKDSYEIIWARIADQTRTPHPGFTPIGFEPSYFVGDHFAAQCDCMLFPRWHGTDKEGTLFLEHFNKLNHYGLFNSPQEAQSFLDYYLSFDWTETGDYFIAEVFVQ